MVTASAPFWRDPAFLQFLPHIKATAAGDKRHFVHPRLDLKGNAPLTAIHAALSYTGRCCACSATIHPFRTRQDDRSIYLAVACENTVRMGCSRGSKATAAYDEIWRMLKDLARADGEQGGLL